MGTVPQFNDDPIKLETWISNLKGTDIKYLTKRREALVRIRDLFPFFHIKSNPIIQKNNLEIISILRNNLKSETDENIKIQIVNLLGVFGCCYSIEVEGILIDLISQLKCKKKSIKSAILKSLETINSSKKIKKSIKKILEEICIEELANTNAQVRINSLELLCKIVDVESSSMDRLQKIYSHFSSADSDPRVRWNSLKCLLILHQRGFCLDIDLYKQAVEALNDDYHQVRYHALELIWILCNLHPSYVFITLREEQSRLVDDGFFSITIHLFPFPFPSFFSFHIFNSI